MKFLITGITGLRNGGVDALLTTVVAGLRRRWPGCGIDVLTYDLPFDSRRAYDADFYANKFRDLSGRPIHQFARKILPRQRRDDSEMNRLVAGADCVIASGGDVFSSDYSGLRRHLMPLDAARRCGVPYFYLGHSIGRFRSKSDADAWLDSARGSAGVSVRESATHRYVVDELMLKEVPVHLAADTAFLLEPAPPEHVAGMWRMYGLEPGRPCVACVVSQGIAHFSQHDERQHVEAWKGVIRHILERTECQVLLIPHVQERAAINDDRLLASRIIREMDYRSPVRIAAAVHSAAEFKGLIGSCEFVIAERMHGAIAGLSLAIPTITVGYSIKAEGIIDDCFGTQNAALRPLIDAKRFVETGGAMEAFDEYWPRRIEMADWLRASIPAVRARAEVNFEALAAALEPRTAANA